MSDVAPQRVWRPSAKRALARIAASFAGYMLLLADLRRLRGVKTEPRW